MKAVGIQRDDLLWAVDQANEYYDHNILLRAAQSIRDGMTFRLSVLSAQGEGVKISGKNYDKPRRSVNCCWHVHRDILGALYLRNPVARIESAMTTYNNVGDFLAKFPGTGIHNIGSPMFPIRADESCDCENPHDDGPIITLLRRAHVGV